jgi:hypothetical protein
MPRFSAFETAVVVNDLDLPEYGVQTDHATKTTTCWIPSEAGKVCLDRDYDLHLTSFSPKEFKVKCKNVEAITINPNLRLAGCLKVDGKEGGSVWLTGMKGANVCVCEVVTSATTSRNIMFSSIELTGKWSAIQLSRLTLIAGRRRCVSECRTLERLG